MILAALAQVAAAAGQIALPLPVEGDFDRDGRRDMAAVERRVDGRGYDLVVHRATGAVATIAPRVAVRALFLKVLPDGTLSYGAAQGAPMLVRWQDGRFTTVRADQG